MKKTLIAACVAQALVGFAQAEEAQKFNLGEITVTATRPPVGEVGEDQVASVITRSDMQKFNRDTVGDALNLLSGVTVTQGTRNEKQIYVRGFDSRQVQLFIDGIPVYVPYDGNVDLNRFSTFDLAEIQVAKGFSSIAYGPNTLGGAINLVTRKPIKAFEGDVKAGFGSGNERHASANVGTNQGSWYFQAGAAHAESDGFPLSSHFSPTTTEDGGMRNNSYSKDDKVSLKFGITPNANDEYSLGYYNQQGVKGQPQSTIPADARYWKWPLWNKEGMYFVSKTELGGPETLKLRLYQDKFENGIDGYTDASYSTLSRQLSATTGRSRYHDESYGGSAELSSTRFHKQEIKLALHYKVDKHLADDDAGVIAERFQDTLTSIGIEDNIHLSSALLLSVGMAHHQMHPDEVYNSSNTALTLPSKKSANDAQIGLFYDYNPATRLYATVAKKTRQPTLKDRFSQKFSTYIENPNLRPEESLNYEVGYQGTPWSGAKAEAALFTSDITDKIDIYNPVPGATSCGTTASTKCQMQNIGKVRATGIELGLRTPVAKWIDVGSNYTYTDFRNLSNQNKLVVGPSQKVTAYTTLHFGDAVELIAFAERNSNRWVSNTVNLSGFTTLNTKLVYRPAKNVTTEAGVTNLTDRNYSLDNGFPSAGRMWFANASYSF